MEASKFFGALFNARNYTHLAHLSAVGGYAGHMALGDFYDGILDLSDDFIETYQGMNGIVDIVVPEVNTPTSKEEVVEFLKAFSQDLKLIRAGFDSNLQNTIDEMQSLTQKTLYKLQYLY